jgi:hypothetical protein
MVQVISGTSSYSGATPEGFFGSFGTEVAQLGALPETSGTVPEKFLSVTGLGSRG